MLNECVVCGGGIRKGYTAPEAACTCEKTKKIRDDKKHEMLVAEARWLTACGWQASDIKDKTEGFVWKDQSGEGSFTQARAVEVQKQIDADPRRQRELDLRIRYVKLSAEADRREKAGISTADLRGEMQRLIDGIIEGIAPTPTVASPPQQ